MAKINLTPSEFADFIIPFLLDNILNPDDVLNENNSFSNFISDIEKKGMKPKILKYYIDLDSKTRLKYKKIRKIFTNEKIDNVVINIFSEKKDKEKEDKENNLLKKSIKKLLNMDYNINHEEEKILNEFIKNIGEV
jgi:hypothetical protein